MLLTFTEAETKNSISINPKNVVSVFALVKAATPEMEPYIGKTVIILSNGNVIVEEGYLDVAGMISGELNQY
jgi:hypothetical protein